MASSANPSPPPAYSPEDLTNAAAAVASQRGSGDLAQRPLRTSQSFRVDEGYSGEETPSVYEDPNQREDMRSVRDSGELKIPAWMTGLNDALREGLCFLCVIDGFWFCFVTRGCLWSVVFLSCRFIVYSFGNLMEFLKFEFGLCWNDDGP